MARIFMKLKLEEAYNLVHIRARYEWKTNFHTQYRHFEYPWFNTAPATFPHFVNYLFRDILDQYVIVYLDNNLVFSENQEQHRCHV